MEHEDNQSQAHSHRLLYLLCGLTLVISALALVAALRGSESMLMGFYEKANVRRGQPVQGESWQPNFFSHVSDRLDSLNHQLFYLSYHIPSSEGWVETSVADVQRLDEVFLISRVKVEEHQAG